MLKHIIMVHYNTNASNQKTFSSMENLYCETSIFLACQWYLGAGLLFHRICWGDELRCYPRRRQLSKSLWSQRTASDSEPCPRCTTEKWGLFPISSPKAIVNFVAAGSALEITSPISGVIHAILKIPFQSLAYSTSPGCTPETTRCLQFL